MAAAVSSKKTFIASLALLALVASAAYLCFVPQAFAKIVVNTVNSTATLSANGRHIHVTGPLATDQAQPVFMRITITQRTTGAIAEGYTYFTGSVMPQQWSINALTITARKFEPGPATVVALAQTRVLGEGPDDSHQWLVNVTLEQN